MAANSHTPLQALCHLFAQCSVLLIISFTMIFNYLEVICRIFSNEFLISPCWVLKGNMGVNHIRLIENSACILVGREVEAGCGAS